MNYFHKTVLNYLGLATESFFLSPNFYPQPYHYPIIPLPHARYLYAGFHREHCCPLDITKD